MMVYFLYMFILGTSFTAGLPGISYSIASMIVGVIGFIAVLFKLKRLEGVMIVTYGLLLGARAFLLMPYSDIANNKSIIDFFMDVFKQRPLAEGLAAILPLAALAAYRSRRGRLGK